MGRWQQGGLEITHEEDLQILNNRLCSSTYEEDRMETLESIYTYSLQMPVTVGTICLQSVFQSLASMDSCEYQLKIIRNVLGGDLRSEFIEMLFENESNVGTLFSLGADKIARLCSVFKSDYYFGRLSRCDACARTIFALVEHNLLESVHHLVSANRDLKEQLVFEGILEVLLEKMERRGVQRGTLHALETLVLALLDGSAANQNYFMELELYRARLFLERSQGTFDTDVFSALLDPLNARVREFQSRLFIPRFVHRAVEKKQYGFLSRLAHNNSVNLRTLVDRYVNKEILAEDAEEDDGAFRLLNDCAAFLDMGGIRSGSYRVNLVLERTGHGADLRPRVHSELESKNVTADLLLYVLFSFDSIQSIAEHLRLEELDGVRRDICLVLFLVHDVPLQLSHGQVVEGLRSFRRFLCSNVLVSDFFTETIIANIGDLIRERTERLLDEEKKALSAAGKDTPARRDMLARKDMPAAEDAETAGLPDGTAGFKKLYNLAHIKETSYRKINDALGLFKAGAKKQDTYDL